MCEIILNNDTLLSSRTLSRAYWSLGVLMGQYALDDRAASGHSLTRCTPTAHILCLARLWSESDRCKQNVNKHLLAESGAYFGLEMVMNA